MPRTRPGTPDHRANPPERQRAVLNGEESAPLSSTDRLRDFGGEFGETLRNAFREFAIDGM
jgi:hypothetical protein